MKKWHLLLLATLLPATPPGQQAIALVPQIIPPSVTQPLIDPFLTSLKQTLKWEGNGCDNDPDDSGGLTCKGITDSEYRKWRKNQGLEPRSVREMDEGEMQAIYKSMYWDKCNASSYQMPLAFAVFDTCVNFGTGVQDWFENLPADPKEGASEVMQRRIKYRHQRVAEKPSQQKFLQGWLNRDNDGLEYIKQYK